MLFSRSQLLAAPTLAGLLFLLPPSIAQTHTNSTQSNLWQRIGTSILNLFGDISNEELKDEISTLLDTARNLIDDNIKNLIDEIEKRQVTDVKNILDKLDELDKNIDNLRTMEYRNNQDLKEKINQIQELIKNVNENLNRIDNIKSETDKIQDLRKMLGSVETDIQDIRGKLGEN